MKTLGDSLSYQPAELSFGTSGLRGLVTDMTDLECYLYVAGFLDFLQKTDELGSGVVYIAGDLRKSTPRILRVVIKAVNDAGLQANYCGLIPTPALAFFAQENRASCIMVTGSHIPADRNGIKFYKASGEVLKSDELGIQKAVAGKRRAIYKQSLGDSLFNIEGSLPNASEPPNANHKAEQLYRDRYTILGKDVLKGKHIIVYQHSAVGRDLLVEILESLGAEVTATGRSEAFIPIDSENVTPDNRAYFRRVAEEYPDNFAIVSTDGDSDRPFVIDETGSFHRGDVVGALVAKELKANFAATPVSSNDAVDQLLSKAQIDLVHTKIGSPYVIESMDKSRAKVRVGWEVNGGFLLGSNVEFMEQVIKRLPTRDAILPTLVILLASANNGMKISEYFKQLPARYTGGGLIDINQEAADAFRALMKDQQKTEVLISKEIDNRKLGGVQDIDLTDGIRINFESKDIIHVRPSGNAPQLRIYTNCDSQQRADSLAEEATAAGGLLEKFIESIRRQLAQSSV